MLCSVVHSPTGVVLGYAEREPRCGFDHCDACGDCLACYESDDCLPHSELRGGEHDFVRYVASVEEGLRVFATLGAIDAVAVFRDVVARLEAPARHTLNEVAAEFGVDLDDESPQNARPGGAASTGC